MDGPPAPERSASAIGQTPCGRWAGVFQISAQKGADFLRAPDPAALGGGTSDRRHWWGDLKGKQPKRRLWRKKRGCFEAAARLAAPNRGRQSECRNGADAVPSLSA